METLKSVFKLLFIVLIFLVIFFLDSIFKSKFQSSIFIDYQINAFAKKHTIKDEELLYENYQNLKKLDPNMIFTGKIYHDVYGKKVYENENVIDLSEVEVDDNFDQILLKLTNINEVSIYNNSLTNQEKLKLKNQFPSINFNWNVVINNKEYDCSIENLDLKRSNISNIEDLKVAIPLFKNLKTVDFSYCNLSNEQLGSLREEFPNIRIDWVVKLGKWSLRTDSVAFSVLVYKFDYKRMTSKDIEVLKYCTNLQALDIGHQAIEDISVIGNLKDLRVLILADNKIKDISPIANLKHLHYLELFMNDITDVKPLENCRELVDLNISFNYRFSNVDGILNFPYLERLWLVSNRIPDKTYTKIKQVYPNIKLVRYGNGSTESGWRTHERYYAMIDMYKKNYISEVFLKYDNIAEKDK